MNELERLLSQNLKSLRAYHGMTQDGLAEAAEISKNYLAEIETGRKYPSSSVFLRLAKALGVPPARLLLDMASMTQFYDGSMRVDELNALIVRELTGVVDKFIPPARKQPPER